MGLSRRALVASAAGGLTLPILPLFLLAHACSLEGFATGGSTSSASAGPMVSLPTSSASSGGGGGQAACPPEMAKIDATAGSDFCIDRYEVTRGDFAAFASSVDGGVAYPDPCAWKHNALSSPPLTPPSLPVTSVDWCDAYAYCASRDKQLCGSTTGEALSLDARNNVTDQWYAACTDNGKHQYPYADQYKAGVCSDCDPKDGCAADGIPDAGGDAGDAAPMHLPALADAGAFPKCEVNGVYDLSGNAWEWENVCEAEDPAHPEWVNCSLRGGNYKFPDKSNPYKCLGCSSLCTATLMRNVRHEEVGFRCCKDLK